MFGCQYSAQIAIPHCSELFHYFHKFILISVIFIADLNILSPIVRLSLFHFRGYSLMEFDFCPISLRFSTVNCIYFWSWWLAKRIICSYRFWPLSADCNQQIHRECYRPLKKICYQYLKWYVFSSSVYSTYSKHSLCRLIHPYAVSGHVSNSRRDYIQNEVSFLLGLLAFFLQIESSHVNESQV